MELKLGEAGLSIQGLATKLQPTVCGVQCFGTLPGRELGAADCNILGAHVKLSANGLSEPSTLARQRIHASGQRRCFRLTLNFAKAQVVGVGRMAYLGITR